MFQIFCEQTKEYQYFMAVLTKGTPTHLFWAHVEPRSDLTGMFLVRCYLAVIWCWHRLLQCCDETKVTNLYSTIHGEEYVGRLKI